MAAYSGFGSIKAVLAPFGKLTDILRWTQSDRELFPLVSELHGVLREGATDEREYKRLVDLMQDKSVPHVPSVRNLSCMQLLLFRLTCKEEKS